MAWEGEPSEAVEVRSTKTQITLRQRLMGLRQRNRRQFSICTLSLTRMSAEAANLVFKRISLGDGKVLQRDGVPASTSRPRALLQPASSRAVGRAFPAG